VDIGYEPLGDLALRFGNPTNEAMRGILFSNTITMPNGLSTGSSEWVQLIIPPSPASETISNSPTDVITHFNESVGMCLDKSYPYPNDSSTTASDSPALTLSDSNEIGASNSQTAEMWLMFQPDFSANWVPLWIVTWTCNGAASGLGTSWSTTGTNNIISVSQSTDSGTTYPIWTNNAENFPWVPPF